MNYINSTGTNLYYNDLLTNSIDLRTTLTYSLVSSKEAILGLAVLINDVDATLILPDADKSRVIYLAPLITTGSLTLQTSLNDRFTVNQESSYRLTLPGQTTTLVTFPKESFTSHNFWVMF
jgi:hypothetical protein